MSPLHEHLDDLVEAPAREVRVDAAAAWAGGVRRRRWRTALAGAGAALAIVLVVLAAASGWPQPRAVDPTGPDGRPGVTGHPDRIEAPWWVRDLPARPGPLAGLVELESGEWRAVSASGQQWGLPDNSDTTPALSADGTMLALAPDDGPYELRDLVSGDDRRFDEVSATEETAYWVSPQQPVTWSPDGSTVAAPGGARGGANGAVAMDVDGSVSVVRRPSGATYVIGWVGDDRLAWLGTPQDPVYVETDLAGDVLRRVELPSLPRGTSQWSGSLSPDGRSLAIAGSRSGSAMIYDLITRKQSAYPPLSPAPSTPDVACPITWVGDEPVVPTHDDVLGGRVRTDPRLGTVTCSTWATDAVAAGPQQSLTDRLPWRWREIGAGTLGALVLAGSVGWRMRRRARRDGSWA